MTKFKCNGCGSLKEPSQRIIPDGGLLGGTTAIWKCKDCGDEFRTWEYGEVEEPEVPMTTFEKLLSWAMFTCCIIIMTLCYILFFK